MTDLLDDKTFELMAECEIALGDTGALIKEYVSKTDAAASKLAGRKVTCETSIALIKQRRRLCNLSKKIVKRLKQNEEQSKICETVRGGAL